MRLNQIKIAGFKSFVDPTKILFPAGITAIVGPNGCGKSNIIDAVRWVMGESSARHLRGDSMEDVIFSGSSGRKPVGQASVELVFDNTDGRLKGEYAQYTEISIKRIATRAGQSKYLLNHGRCRRRDIADIFLGTGLGSRSYSIIEQGMVSRIIDAKPEELRIYLEEAGGISKYKERRRETETRIRHTRENLDRLTDILEEIGKQLYRLDRQAKTAEKYQGLKQEQRQLEAESLLLQKRVFDQGIGTQERELVRLENAMQAHLAQLRQVESKLEEHRLQLSVATEQHNQVQSEYYRLGSEITNKEQMITHQKSLRQHHQQELEGIHQALQDAEQAQSGDEQQLQQHIAGIGDLQPQLERQVEQLKQQEVAVTAAESEMASWQDSWDSFTRQFHQAHESVQIENRGIEHIERQMLQAQKRRDRLQAELQTLDTSTHDGEIIALEHSIAARTEEHAVMLAQLQTNSDEILQLRQNIDQQSIQLDSTRNQVQTLRGRLSALEALQKHALAESSEAVQAWLARYQIDSSQRLTERLKVRDQVEKAVEVVLGDFLGCYCLAADRSMPDDALLSNLGLALLERQRVESFAVVEREWPQLIDFIDCDYDLSGLLSGVYFCQTLAELRVREKQLKAHESLVTREGLWVGANWLLQLDEEDPHSGVLAREQEIKLIRAQLDEMTQSALQLKSRTDGDRQQLELKEQQRDADQRALSQLHHHTADAQNQLSQRKNRVEQAGHRYQQIQVELVELDEQKSKQDLELKTIGAKRNEMLSVIEDMAVQEADFQQRKLRLQQALGASRDQLQQERKRQHQLQIELMAHESEQRAILSNIARIKQQRQQLDQRQSALVTAIAETESPLQGLEADLQQLLELHSQQQQLLSHAQESVTALDNQQANLTLSRGELQAQSDAMRNQLETQRMRCQELTIRCNTITEQLQKTGFKEQDLIAGLAPDAVLEAWQERLQSLTRRIDRLGPINLVAIEEYKEQLERKTYLDAQNQDLVSALSTLEAAMHTIDKETRERFKETFDQVNKRFSARFPKLFGGGEGHLDLTESDFLSTGVVIMARPPGKRVTHLSLLSGGEKALTAVALIFAIFELNPSPFCLLDEVDAPLDDANVGRFCTMVEEMSEQVQFIMISHNKITMEIAQNLNGVTMHEPGVSRLVSVDVSEAVALTGS